MPGPSSSAIQSPKTARRERDPPPDAVWTPTGHNAGSKNTHHHGEKNLPLVNTRRRRLAYVPSHAIQTAKSSKRPILNRGRHSSMGRRQTRWNTIRHCKTPQHPRCGRTGHSRPDRGTRQTQTRFHVIRRRGHIGRQQPGQQRRQTITHCPGSIGPGGGNPPPKCQARTRLRIRRSCTCPIKWAMDAELIRSVRTVATTVLAPAEPEAAGCSHADRSRPLPIAPPAHWTRYRS